MAAYQHITVEACTDHLGAEVAGLDLRQPLNDEVLGELRAAYSQHSVLFFRDQDLTPEEHIRFAQSWGEININRFFTAVEGYPQVAEVRKEPDQQVNIGGGWHTDHSYDQIPALGSMLYARQVPPRGGDTLFASMSAVFDGLSDGLKATLEGLNAVHSSRHVFGAAANRPGDLNSRLGNAEAATQDAIHPVVIRHPLSGRKVLYVNPAFTRHIEGWTDLESAPLLTYLYQQAGRPEYSVRFRWQPGSMAFWDNRATWHYALNDYQGERRLMHRITLEGCELGR
ncbi:MAG: TauD/TfdA family dioxygenase [Proteobacteria bacterium]|nr:TauD/TfdA family dioxygenase [Pseudomonadota bacterium]